MTGSALQRTVGRAAARRAAAEERCELCAVPVPVEHRHVLDIPTGSLLCACRACALLFERDAAAEGRYRMIPTRRVRLVDLPNDLLDVPVGLAFFVRQDDGGVLAHYPSPLGTTEHAVDADAWRAVEERCPAVGQLRPRVEAVLVRVTAGRGGGSWILPIDECFRLVAVIRTNWSGMSGGSAVWREVARFFADLDPSSSPTSARRGVGNG